jgi:cupin domain
VLAGEMEIIVDDESLNPGPGMFVLVRAGQRHTFANPGAEDGTRTRDPDLGKVVLYQLSHFRVQLSNE